MLLNAATIAGVSLTAAVAATSLATVGRRGGKERRQFNKRAPEVDGEEDGEARGQVGEGEVDHKVMISAEASYITANFILALNI